MSQELPPVGPSGVIARAFQNNHLTPLLAILAIGVGGVLTHRVLNARGATPNAVQPAE